MLGRAARAPSDLHAGRVPEQLTPLTKVLRSPHVLNHRSLATYPQWVAELSKQYQLTINWELWNQFQPAGTESDSRPKDESP